MAKVTVSLLLSYALGVPGFHNVLKVQTCSFAEICPDQNADFCSRRNILQQALIIPSLVLGLVATSPPFAVAETFSRPYEYAPTEALLPAARVKILIDQALDIANKLVREHDKGPVSVAALVNQLEELLLKPQNFVRSTTKSLPPEPAKQYLQAYREGRQKLPLLAKPGAALVQSGEIDTWKRLKRQEEARERQDEILAALNVYTTQLSFDAARYSLTATKQERSDMIRNEKLPDVKTVISGDLDLRYLYRNQVLSDMDNARAELRYQMKNSESGGFDATELRDLLLEAQSDLNQWFGLIDEESVKEALVIVMNES
jgi:hypothetical protein